MRIIGGSAAGMILKAPQGLGVRPTPDLVRQAIFNSLGLRVVGARVLELFGGTGALSLECLSRGAAVVTCVEQSRKHARYIEQNLGGARLPRELFRLRVQDAFTILPQLVTTKDVFDLILADPPFGEKNVGCRSTSLSQQLLDDTFLTRLIAPEGLFVLGHTRRDTLSVPTAWREVKELKHGDSRMLFLERSE